MKRGFTFRHSAGQTPVERSLAVNQPPEPPRPAGGAAKAAVWLSCLSPLAALLVDFDNHASTFFTFEKIQCHNYPFPSRFREYTTDSQPAV